MRRFLFFWIVTVVIANPVFVGAQNFSDRFAKGNTSFGGELGFGHTFNLPPGKIERISVLRLYFRTGKKI